MIQTPTDSPYKFLAISGLLLIGYSMYFYFNDVNSLRLQMLEVENEIEYLNYEADRLIPLNADLQDILDIDNDFFDCAENNKEKFDGNKQKTIEFCATEDAYEAIQKRYYQALELNDQLHLLVDEKIELNLLRVNGKVRRLEYLSERNKFFGKFLIILMFVGPSLATFGFIKWFQRDKELQHKNTSENDG